MHPHDDDDGDAIKMAFNMSYPVIIQEGEVRPRVYEGKTSLPPKRKGQLWQQVEKLVEPQKESSNESSGWIRAGGGMAAGGFPSGRHSIMTERTPLFGYVRSKLLIPHDVASTHTLTSASVPLGLCRRTLVQIRFEVVEEDAMTSVCNGVNQL
jgi:hypothetical protein